MSEIFLKMSAILDPRVPTFRSSGLKCPESKSNMKCDMSTFVNVHKVENVLCHRQSFYNK